MKNLWLIVAALVVIALTAEAAWGQLLDNYDGVDDLVYTTDGVWVISGGQFEAQTNGLSTPEHSYASYDLTLSIAAWQLDKANQNEWVGWMDLNRESVGGWGAGSYSCGMVLAANGGGLNAGTTKGYAVGFKNDGTLVLFRFDAGIVGGTSALPGSSTELVSSGYIYSNVDNGVNFYVKLESDGKWTIKYKAGTKLSDADAVNPADYSDGSATSPSSDETYSGSDFKYVGWVYAHSSGGSEKVFFDNLGVAEGGALPIQLASCSASVLRGSDVELRWKTLSETNNFGFEIDRKRGDVGPWISVGFVEGHGTTLVPQLYSYLDRSVPFGKYQYRVRQIDLDGKEETFPEMEVNVGLEPGKFILAQNYPNPFNPSTTIEFVVPQAGWVTLKVYNLLGQEVATLQDGNAEANKVYIKEFDAGALASGLYYYQLRGGGAVLTKRMLLLR
jgi:hypothetical protein